MYFINGFLEFIIDLPLIVKIIFINSIIVSIISYILHPAVCKDIRARRNEIEGKYYRGTPHSIFSIISYGKEQERFLKRNPDPEIKKLMQIYRTFWIYGYISYFAAVVFIIMLQFDIEVDDLFPHKSFSTAQTSEKKEKTDSNTEYLISFLNQHRWANGGYPEEPETVTELIKDGADPNTRYTFSAGWQFTRFECKGITPLHQAAFWKIPETMQALIDGGAEVNSKTEEGGYTPLIFLIFRYKTLKPEKDRAKGLRILLDSGADINLADDTGMTPLLIAAIQDRTDLIKLLISAGADINAERSNTDKTTPLEWAARNNSEETIRILLDAGAEINHVSENGTPLDAAIKEENSTAADYLRDAGGKTAEQLGVAINA